MNPGRDQFAAFLEELGLPEREAVLARFDAYHRLLWDKNSQVNLFSRATTEDELWTKHFLDSLVALKCFEFSGKKVLDFGSGAGLPGIPIKLAVPDCRMVLLDSVRKKALALVELVAGLELVDCEAECARLEDYAREDSGFDYVLCRAVKLETRYLKPLKKLLKPSGLAVFYKAQDISDLEPWQPEERFNGEFAYGRRSLHTLKPAQMN